MALRDHFRPCMTPAPSGAVAVLSLSGHSHWDAATGPQGCAVLYTTRMAAWTPRLGLRGLFLAALHHSRNQSNRFENGERFHVIAWYCFAPMGPTLCVRLDDPSGSMNALVWPQGTTCGRARPALRQVQLQYHRRSAGLQQQLGCCHGPETLWSFLDDPSGAWHKNKVRPGLGRGAQQKVGDALKTFRLNLQLVRLKPAFPS